MSHRFQVTEELIDRIHRARYAAGGGVGWWSIYRQRSYLRRKTSFYPICQGCRKDLIVGESVVEFRAGNYVHDSRECVSKIAGNNWSLVLKTLFPEVQPKPYLTKATIQGLAMKKAREDMKH